MRVIDTIDGRIGLKTAYESGTDKTFTDVYQEGNDPECAFNWDYIGSIDYVDLDFASDEVLEDMYYSMGE